MKKWNRIIKTSGIVLLILASVLCFTACGASATPKVEDKSGAAGALTWEYKQETKTLTVRGVGEMPNFASSSEVAWMAVRSGVETIVVGEGITTVGDYAFYYMPYAKNVSLPSSVKSIGKYAFGFCSALEGITIPESVTAVGDSAFEACVGLKSIVISPNVTSLGARAFALCSSLTDATVVANVQELRAETFYGCKSLTNLILHTGIPAENVHETAFALATKGFADAERRDTVEGSYDIVISYSYEDGSEASPTIREEKLNGESYLYVSPAIEGYTADKTQIQGVLNGAGVNEKVTYKKNAEPEQTPPAENPPAETPAVTEPEEEQSKGELIISVVVLAVVVIGIAVGAFFLLRNNKKNDAKNGKHAPKNGKKK